MKKILAMLLCLCLFVTLFACGEEVGSLGGDQNDKNQGEGEKDDTAKADPLYLDVIQTAGKKIYDAKAADMTLVISPTFSSEGISVNIPMTMSLKYKYTGDLEAVDPNGDPEVQLKALGLSLAGSVEIKIPAIISGSDESAKVEFCWVDGFFYCTVNGQKIKMTDKQLFDAMKKAQQEGETELPDISEEQIKGLMQMIFNGVKAPSNESVKCDVNEENGVTEYAYSVKGADVDAYVKAVLGIVCQNIDKPETKAALENIIGALGLGELGEVPEFEEDETEYPYSRVYDFDSINWDEFCQNELDMTFDELREMYVSYDPSYADMTAAEWDELLRMEFDPDYTGPAGPFDNVESATDFYNALYGELVSMSFDDVVYKIGVKDGLLASVYEKCGFSFGITSTSEFTSDVTVDVSFESTLTVNAVGDKVVITAPVDADSYMYLPEDAPASSGGISLLAA